MAYNYKEGKKRIEEILNNEITIYESGTIPKSEDVFTFSNGYYTWVTAIFVDIRDSSSLFSKKALEDKQSTAKVVRSFTSEIIEILKSDDNYREIGIRGDCVYAIYSTPLQYDILKCADLTVEINTYIKMLNKMLGEKNIESISAGIGMASDRELIIKAGRSRSGINSKVWIGNAVTRASNLSSLGDKFGGHRIYFSSLSYDNFIELFEKKNPGGKEWFHEKYDNYQKVYSADIICTEFNNWIDEGMI